MVSVLLYLCPVSVFPRLLHLPFPLLYCLSFIPHSYHPNYRLSVEPKHLCGFFL